MAFVTIGNEKKEVTQGTTFEDLALEYQKDYDAPIALVYVNGCMKELSRPIEKDCEVQFITLKDDAGHKAYVRTATLMMMKAITDIPLSAKTANDQVSERHFEIFRSIVICRI